VLPNRVPLVLRRRGPAGSSQPSTASGIKPVVEAMGRTMVMPPTLGESSRAPVTAPAAGNTCTSGVPWCPESAACTAPVGGMRIVVMHALSTSIPHRPVYVFGARAVAAPRSGTG
jgi:hypothetical protein